MERLIGAHTWGLTGPQRGECPPKAAAGAEGKEERAKSVKEGQSLLIMGP